MFKDKDWLRLVNRAKRKPWEIHNADKIIGRNNTCSFCGIRIKVYPPGSKYKYKMDRAEIEHLDNNEHNKKASNIFLCCGRCNRSKGTRNLTDWLKSEYCKEKNISRKSIRL